MGLFSFLRTKEPTLPPLRFHNTLSGTTEEFTPLSHRAVKMYNCGPTVYDRQHLGNMFAVILADTLRRTLVAWGYPVKQVINITDFGHLTGDNEGDPNEGDDKMTSGLKREGLALTMPNMRKLAEKYTHMYLEDIALLGVDTTKITFPRASDYIAEQIALIKTLEQKGYAYDIADGIYYDTAKFKTYGKLGNINLEGQREGVRVEEKKDKKNPHDFVLWKASEKMGWDSPWGKGFPGWHIECTAMIFTLLGKQIDIHTGGIEHIPIHHNNEIAQAEAATGKKFANYWLHNAHITIEGKKVSKSLGNTVYLHNIVDKGYNPRAFRYWVLTGHYRTPMNFTWEAIEGANTALRRLTRTYLELPEGGTAHSAFLKEFYGALSNDLSTAAALALVWDFIKGSGVYGNVSPADKKATLKKVDRVLGLGFSEPQEAARLKVSPEKDLPKNIQALLADREAARKEKDFAKADTLRKEIEDAGYELKDTPNGAELIKK